MKAGGETNTAEEFYGSALRALLDSGIPFLVGGAYSLREYADIWRDTKDLDVFCKAGDYTRLLRFLSDAGYETSIADANWLAKARRCDHFIDLIFNSDNGLCAVDDSWFEHARDVELLGLPVKLIPPEEQIWQKAFIQDRHRFDGADVLHMIRKCGRELDWWRLLSRMDVQWEVLLAQLLTFRFVYPSERDAVPRWLMEDLLGRAQAELSLPTPEERMCRGPLLSRQQYHIDITDWGYEWGFKTSH
ncbi:MAG: nucleotidyltransferase [Chloroflexi bacterium]|nr:nucleotidyltransferase [Chloroflexota bacterium]